MVHESLRCAVPRVPGDLAALVPEGVPSALICSAADPALPSAVRARGVERVAMLHAGDPAPAGVDAAYPGDLLAATREGGPLEGAAFTVIVSNHDLPRYRNPEPYLKAVRALLVPGGLFILSTPNMQYHRAVRALAESGWAYEEEGVWSRDALRFFTAVELKRLTSAHGFEALRSMPLRSDAPETFPLDAQGYVRAGRVHLGPLTPSEHQSYLAADIVCLAMRPAW
ncbi:MAG: N-acetylglucosaminyl-diphospho-decaprenol L-rhamnosyltransferase [Candidatus Hydrogenedentota bacterium]